VARRCPYVKQAARTQPQTEDKALATPSRSSDTIATLVYGRGMIVWASLMTVVDLRPRLRATYSSAAL